MMSSWLREFFRYLVVAALLCGGLLCARAYFWGHGEPYPQRVTLSNQAGRTVDLILYGRTAQMVDVQRVGTSERAYYPIEELTWLSKARVYLYPEWNTVIVDDADDGYDAELSLSEIHRQELLKRRAVLTDEIVLLSQRMDTADTRVARNSYYEQQLRCIKKLEKLDVELANRGQ